MKYLRGLFAVFCVLPLSCTKLPKDTASPEPDSAPVAPFAAVPEATGPSQVRIEMQIVALPENLAVPMVPDLLDKKKIEAAYAKLQTYLADGRAILVGWPTLTTKSGQRAVIEAAEEICYPSELYLPDLNDAPPVAEGGTAKLDATPLAFEHRNAGVTLEVEPVVSPDGTIIDLNLVPQHVSLQGYKTSTFEVSKNGAKATVRGQHPEFHTNKVTTSLSFGNGQRKLLGTYKVANPESYMEFFILKVEIEQVP